MGRKARDYTKNREKRRSVFVSRFYSHAKSWIVVVAVSSGFENGGEEEQSRALVSR
jgi:hypothetical protein